MRREATNDQSMPKLKVPMAAAERIGVRHRPSGLRHSLIVDYRSLVILWSLVFGHWSFGVAPSDSSRISLTDSQRIKLAALATSDAEAKKLFQKLLREADASVNAKGNPIRRLGTAGKLAGDPLKVQSRASLEDMKKLNALGYSYALTGKAEYGAAARRIILRWAKVNQPTGVPIDETKLEPLFTAYDLTRSTFSPRERKSVADWLRSMAALELQSAHTNSVTSSNNWQSHRLKIVGLIGFMLEDKPLIQESVEGFKKQIQDNLAPDGSSFDFHQRDALRYHCYDLEPLLTLALVAGQNGIDLYDYAAPSGASLPKAVAFLAPFCDGTRTHAEWVHSKVKFDRQRAEAGEKGFEVGAAFDPREARGVFERAAFFEARYGPLVLRLYSNGAAEYPGWQSVLNRVRASNH